MHRRRLPAALLAGLAGLALLVGTPGMAAAEGPGYDGRADQLVLAWQDGEAGGSAGGPDTLVVFGRGFRAGSEVALRVGATVEKVAVADPTGTVRMRLEGSAHPGTTIVATGQAPSGSVWTLLGAVPSVAVARGPQAFVAPGLASFGALALLAMLIRRLIRRRGGHVVAARHRAAT